MAKMTFSVPDDVKDRFNKAFADANKSAVVTKLMVDALDQIERKRRSDKAIRSILSRRAKNKGPFISTEEILKTRDEIRAESDAAHGIPRK
ncbi:MAG: hypothetical protein M0P39_06570 [Rhodocyclaceae bacterium]|jgi:predicted transcriptional regulator|nr:hypothetical protein [Rhodocyclaceae bacterium]